MKKFTPLKSVRKYCLWCMNGQPNEIRLDPSTDCPLFNLRFGKGSRTILKFIKLRCIDCVGGIRNVSKCDAIDCDLFSYRMGHRPKNNDNVLKTHERAINTSKTGIEKAS